MTVSARRPLTELALLFLRLGTTAFGGPAAHLAMMEDEVVRRRGWMTREEFIDLLGATHLIPGPNSTEMAIHIGYRRAGWPGLLVAGVCFIVPAAAITLIFASAYVRFGSYPSAEAVLYGIKPVVIGIVVHAIWRLGNTALRSARLAVLAAIAVAAIAAGVNEIVVLLGAGVVGIALRGGWSGGGFAAAAGAAASDALPWSASPLLADSAAAAPFNVVALSLVFLKIGAVLFGSGYVLLAFLQSELIDQRHWLTPSQLLDAVAVGQITPGPIFTTATFIGYLLGRTPGAVAATIGIFLPAFVFVAVSGPLLPRLRRSPLASGFLDGVNAAAIALMAAVVVALARSVIIDVPTAGLALASLVLLVRWPVNSAWLVLAGGVIGVLATRVLW